MLKNMFQTKASNPILTSEDLPAAMPRAHGREQDLMKENRSLKRRINKLECENNNPKMVPHPDLQSVRKELYKVKTELKDEQNALTVKHLAEFKKQCGQEKLLRQQMERKLERFDKTKILNDTLNTEVDALNIRVQKLAGCKHVAEQKSAGQSNALKLWETKHIALNKELKDIELLANGYKEQNYVLLLESKKHEN